MTETRWQRIVRQIDNGDPLKDIDCDEEELYAYCVELRKRVKDLLLQITQND